NSIGYWNNHALQVVVVAVCSDTEILGKRADLSWEICRDTCRRNGKIGWVFQHGSDCVRTGLYRDRVISGIVCRYGAAYSSTGKIKFLKGGKRVAAGASASIMIVFRCSLGGVISTSGNKTTIRIYCDA